ncbi:MAG: ABC transporter ATP-binding protein, partial [Maritimibacter sp.]
MNKMTPIIDAQNVAVSFKVEGGIVEAVRDVSFTLYRGKTTALVGESGSGKSVTARAIMKLLSKRAIVSDQSKITFDGTDMASLSKAQMRALRGNRISMIFQEPMSSLNPVYKIGAQLAEAIMLHQRLSRKAALARAVELLDEVRVPDPEARINQYPHQLSGGQRQRVMIAMALANRPDVLIADEPTTALDVTVQAEILHLIDELKRKYGMGVILITHDLTVVRQFADHVYVMQHGEVQEEGPTEAIFGSPQHPYTQRLLASDPKGVAEPLSGTPDKVLDGKNVRVEFKLRRGGFFNSEVTTLVAADGLDIDIRRGETLGLVGESGSGKTTFGQALLRLIHMDDGEICFLGNQIEANTRKEMKPYRSRMQIVFQDPFASLNPRMSVRQIIEEGLIVNGIGKNAKDRFARVQQALRDAGLPDTITHRFPHEFSGGQRQRLAIARAIALEPEFILLDEPTSALDLSVQAQIIALLRKLQAERGLSYLFISHDLKVVRALCHR